MSGVIGQSGRPPSEIKATNPLTRSEDEGPTGSLDEFGARDSVDGYLLDFTIPDGALWHKGHESNRTTACYYEWLDGLTPDWRWRCSHLLKMAWARREDNLRVLEISTKEWYEHWSFPDGYDPSEKYPHFNPASIGQMIYFFSIKPAMTIDAAWDAVYGGVWTNDYPRVSESDDIPQLVRMAGWIEQLLNRMNAFHRILARSQVATMTGKPNIDWQKEQALWNMLDREAPSNRSSSDIAQIPSAAPSTVNFNFIVVPGAQRNPLPPGFEDVTLPISTGEQRPVVVEVEIEAEIEAAE